MSKIEVEDPTLWRRDGKTWWGMVSGVCSKPISWQAITKEDLGRDSNPWCVAGRWVIALIAPPGRKGSEELENVESSVRRMAREAIAVALDTHLAKQRAQ